MKIIHLFSIKKYTHLGSIVAFLQENGGTRRRRWRQEELWILRRQEQVEEEGFFLQAKAGGEVKEDKEEVQDHEVNHAISPSPPFCQKNPSYYWKKILLIFLSFSRRKIVNCFFLNCL